MVSTKNLVTCL